MSENPYSDAFVYDRSGNAMAKGRAKVDIESSSINFYAQADLTTKTQDLSTIEIKGEVYEITQVQNCPNHEGNNSHHLLKFRKDS